MVALNALPPVPALAGPGWREPARLDPVLAAAHPPPARLNSRFGPMRRRPLLVKAAAPLAAALATGAMGPAVAAAATLPAPWRHGPPGR
jgi:hypothetical protein